MSEQRASIAYNKRLIAVGYEGCGQERFYDGITTLEGVSVTQFSLPQETESFNNWTSKEKEEAGPVPAAIVTMADGQAGRWWEGLREEDLVVHLQASYPTTGLSVAMLRHRFRGDAGIRSLAKKMKHRVIDASVVDFFLSDLMSNFGIEVPSNKQVVTPTYKTVPLAPAEIQLLEDRRLALNAAPYLSTTGQQHDLSVAADLPLNFKQNLRVDDGFAFIFADSIPSDNQLQQLLKPAALGTNAYNLVCVFETFNTIRPLLYNPISQYCLQNNRLKLWHVAEWKELMHQTFCENIRCGIFACHHVLASAEKEELRSEIEKYLRAYQVRYVQEIDKSRKSAVEYYRSSAFQERLDAIAAGEKPRVLIEQACHTVATKQFSRNAAAALHDLGCPIYQHANCGADSVDYVIANVIEVARFLPDLIIRPPNQFGTPEDESQREQWGKLPVMMSLQDLEPHLILPRYLQNHKLRAWDMVLLLQERFRDSVISAGVGDEQVLCEYIPAEAPAFDLETYPMKGRRDIGFVKTLSPIRRLIDRIAQKKEGESLSEEMCHVITHAEQEIRARVSRGESMKIEELSALGDVVDISPTLFILYHEELCIQFANTLVGAEIPLVLHGGNWEKIEGMTSFARGHIHSRLRYMQQFLENKINLSINPWNEYHPRIFDGGRCGAFFLVYRVPDEIRWQPLPPELKAGVHFDYFISKKELVEKCLYYLEHEDERMQIGHNLKKAIEANYTYEQMMGRILDRYRNIVKKHLSTKGTLRS